MGVQSCYRNLKNWKIEDRVLPIQLADKSSSKCSAFWKPKTFIITIGNISEGIFTPNRNFTSWAEQSCTPVLLKFSWRIIPPSMDSIRVIRADRGRAILRYLLILVKQSDCQFLVQHWKWTSIWVQELNFQFLVLLIKLPISRSALRVHEHLRTMIKCSIPRFGNKIVNSSFGPESAPAVHKSRNRCSKFPSSLNSPKNKATRIVMIMVCWV